MDIIERATHLYEAIADDEGLRGSLTDTGYGPLLSWTAQRAAQLGADSTDEEVDTLTETLRAAVASIVAAAETGDPTELTGIDPLIADPSIVAEAVAALATAPTDPDERAVAMAHALAVESD
jgi:hypothetical protein